MNADDNSPGSMACVRAYTRVLEIQVVVGTPLEKALGFVTSRQIPDAPLCHFGLTKDLLVD
jgi:hypothetical protein